MLILTLYLYIQISSESAINKTDGCFELRICFDLIQSASVFAQAKLLLATPLFPSFKFWMLDPIVVESCIIIFFEFDVASS